MSSNKIRTKLTGNKANRVTLKDVADRAGVSPITVSRVANNYQGVRSEVRKKVEQAIKELGYIPNRSASILASSRSKLIGVLIPSLSNVVFNEVLRGIYSLAVPADYQILLADTHYSPLEEERSIRTLLGQSPEGLIISGGEQTDATKAMLKASGVPIVQIMDQIKDPIDMNVGFSHYQAGAAVAKALLEKSYQKIGFLGARMDPRTCTRLEGFSSVLSAHNCLDLKRVITNPQPSSVATGAMLFRELMAATDGDCDAIFCCNDDLALGALYECKKMHINVPNNFGICGFNDIEVAAYAEPSLSSVKVNRYLMGSIAMELIFKRLNINESHALTSSLTAITQNADFTNSTFPKIINTGFELVMRNSTRML